MANGYEISDILITRDEGHASSHTPVTNRRSRPGRGIGHWNRLPGPWQAIDRGAHRPGSGDADRVPVGIS